jgi:hypothetical protein
VLVTNSVSSSRTSSQTQLGSAHTDPTTDVYARVVVRAAWGANRAAREIWGASDAKRDPRQLVNEAFDVLGDCVRPGDASVTKHQDNAAAPADHSAAAPS